MTDQPRCPLCGGTAYQGHYELKCVACGLPEKYWPRIRELVAIRDAAAEWYVAKPYSLVQADCANKLWDLARKETERGNQKQA